MTIKDALGQPIEKGDRVAFFPGIVAGEIAAVSTGLDPRNPQPSIVVQAGTVAGMLAGPDGTVQGVFKLPPASALASI